MENIIEELIKIEQAAESSIKRTEDERKNLTVKIELLQKEIEQKTAKETDEKAANLHNAALIEAKEKITQIEVDGKRRLEALEAEYAANKEIWEEAIFNNIIKNATI